MTGELLHDALVIGLLVSLGFGLEHMRIRWALKRKKMKRQHLPNGSALQHYAPVWANASHVKEMKR